MAPHQNNQSHGFNGQQRRFKTSDVFRLLAMVAGGALVARGLRDSGTRRNLQTAGGIGMTLAGAAGLSPVRRMLGREVSPGRVHPLDLRTVLTVNAPREVVAAYWRQLENLPRFMRHLSEVSEIGEGRWHWVLEVPGGVGTLSWDADVRISDKRVSWQSVPGSPIENSGEVTFHDAPGDRGTEVHARITYRPPAGRLGHAASKLLTPVFTQLVTEDIRRFKHVIEAGEVPTA